MQFRRLIITGDCTQIDLPPSQRSGLLEALRILKNIEGISFINLDKSDIVRHRLVARIVDAYDEEARRRKTADDTNNFKTNINYDKSIDKD